MMLSTIGSLIIIGAGLVLAGMNSDTDNSSDETKEDRTYNYWMTLTPQEREDYFYSNEYLKSYGDKYFYHDKYQIAKSVSEIARKENREFTNRFNRF